MMNAADLRLHPEADIVPAMTPDEYDAFLADVDTRGITTPLTVTTDGVVLDGRHRFGAAVTLDIRSLPVHVVDVPRDRQVDFMVRQAVLRRHLSIGQRRELAGAMLRENPAQSDRQVATVVGLSDKTVGAVRGRLEGTADIPQLDSRVGLDGKLRVLPTVSEHVATAPTSWHVSGGYEVPAPVPDRRWNPGAGLMSSDTPEWYTPRRVLAAVVDAIGPIDLDPCAEPAKSVPAGLHFIEDDDGLAREWHGSVYMNPPYGRPIVAWIDKLVTEYQAGRTTEAIALVPARVETDWYLALDHEWECQIHGRLAFSDHDTAAPFPSMAVYLGPNGDRFESVFVALGDVKHRRATGRYAR